MKGVESNDECWVVSNSDNVECPISCVIMCLDVHYLSRTKHDDQWYLHLIG